MIDERNILEKGSYDHPQQQGYIILKQYMLIGEADKKCLLLRFANESDVEICAFEFMLFQLDASGKVIKKSKIRYAGMGFGAKKTYTPAKAIVVLEKCVDFRIRMLSFISEPYKYEYKRGQIVIHYDVRGYIKKKSNDEDTGRIVCTSQKNAFSKFNTLLATMLLVLVLATCALVKYLEDSQDFKFNTALQAGDSRESESVCSSDGLTYTFDEGI